MKEVLQAVMDIRYRQVHLDFHTSQYITEIGRDFSARDFGDTLQKAHVNSITCFARCHHGWLYYPSKKNPELIHPNLKNKNLLLEQIAECHKRGIKVPVYTTVRWDERIAREHPEWLCRDTDGNPVDMGNVPEPHFYYGICLNSGYREFFKAHISDIIDVVGEDKLDGLFMDIVVQTECACDSCRKIMLERGLDPASRNDRVRFAAATLNEFRDEISSLIRSRVPNATIFYNDSCVDKVLKRSIDTYSHMEIESLASGDWGYDHFPITVRYAAGMGKDMIGMTGKFHTSWGDFHSLKNKAALEFECFHMLALGAGCSVGDQLHPWGELSDATYRLIGDVYQSVEEKEKYCYGAKPVCEIAVVRPEENFNPILDGRELPKALIGACHIFQELAWQFAIIDSDMELEGYKAVVLPDGVEYSKEFEEKLKAYVAQGGRVLATFDSCIDENGNNEVFGVQGIVKSYFSREFVLPNNLIGKELAPEPLVMYERGNDITCHSGEVILEKTEPWFEREGVKFCSHQHAPTPVAERRADMIRNGNVIYCGHPLFGIYRKNAPKWCKELVGDALRILVPDKRTEHNGPSGLLCILNKKGDDTEILHLLYYIPEKISEEIYTIEDVVPLHDISISVSAEDRGVASVRKVPEWKEIDYNIRNGRIMFEVDELKGHCMIEIQYSMEKAKGE